MNRNTAALYELVIDRIKAVAVQVNGIPLEPKLMISDYEIEILTKVAAKFPSVRARGCYFHQSQVKTNIYNYCKYKSMLKSLSEYKFFLSCHLPLCGETRVTNQVQ